MGNFYYNVERKADIELRNKRKKEEIEMLEETIRSLTQDPLKNGLTEEQMFLIRYYGLDEQEIIHRNFDSSDIEKIVENRTRISEEELETNRYNELIDMYSIVENFDIKGANKYNDRFHRDIKDWNDYTRDFEQVPLIVKKMRNLQMLNRMAHSYQVLLRKILYGRSPEIVENYTERDKKILESRISGMFSKAKNYAESVTQELIEQYGNQQVNEWKNNKAIQYCVNASRWMFKQKDTYMRDILQDLQNSNENYSYGILNDAFVFDVPGYGQFCVHLGRNNSEEVERLRQLYDVQDYKGEYLGKVYILSKAAPELLKNVDYESLSSLDKQRYKIASQKINEANIKEEQESINAQEADYEKQEEITEEKLEYEEIRKMTSNMADKKQNIESIEQIISKLEETRKTLKRQIGEMEEKINSSILDTNEPTTELIEDIKKMKKIVEMQKEKRKEVKQMIKRYKGNKKAIKYALKQEKKARNSAIDYLEL